MNRKGFFATVAAAFGMGVGASVAKASESTAKGPGYDPTDYPEYQDPEYSGNEVNVGVGGHANTNDITQIYHHIHSIYGALQDINAKLDTMQVPVNTAVEDNDRVSQNASATDSTAVDPVIDKLQYLVDSADAMGGMLATIEDGIEELKAAAGDDVGGEKAAGPAVAVG